MEIFQNLKFVNEHDTANSKRLIEEIQIRIEKYPNGKILDTNNLISKMDRFSKGDIMVDSQPIHLMIVKYLLKTWNCSMRARYVSKIRKTTIKQLVKLQ